MSSDTFSPDIPRILPELYMRIMGKKCKHQFIKGGFGISIGFLITCSHADGASMSWSMAHPRMLALEALYGAFSKTGDRETAVAIYAFIEDSYPLDKITSTLQDATRPFRNVSVKEEELEKAVQAIEAYDDEAGRMARKILELNRLTRQLKEVETTADFQKLAREFTKTKTHEP
ncbi:MAG TPA: hypothetical protein DCZ94_11440 [Lentisphaeria bacterium]|nr:MAG: hypothetical protein A2X48_17530 [Lentisphaerae bacterium GWF2_49_21]HBC87560.1 hypothetical protein [Lentisphaeria bacterium]